MVATPEIRAGVRAGRREWTSLAVLTLAVVLLAVDATVLALAVPALSRDLDPDATQLLWIGDIYSFALAGLLVTMGNVADRIGRKRLLLIGSVGFGIASAIAAFAPTAEALIAARALLGLSGATLMPSTLSIVRTMFDDARQRRLAIAIWSAGATGGAAAGPLIGGALLEHFPWGSVFLINVPVVAVIVVAGLILLPESRNPSGSPIDLVSAALSIAAIVPVVYAVKHLVTGSIDATMVAAAVVGIVSAVLFAWRQRRLETPLIDLSLFRIPAFGGAVASDLLSVFAFSGLLFFFSQYLQLVRGLDPLQAGAMELPSTIASLAAIPLVGVLAARIGMGRSIAVGLGTAAIGLALLALSEGVDGYVLIGVALAAAGIGVGIAYTLSTDAIVGAAPKDRAGAATSISETAYELGSALGIAVLGSLQTVVYRASAQVPEDAPRSVRSAAEDSLAAGLRTLEGAPGSDDLVASLRHSFTLGMQTASVVAAVILAASAIVAWRVIPSLPETRKPAARGG